MIRTALGWLLLSLLGIAVAAPSSAAGRAAVCTPGQLRAVVMLQGATGSLLGELRLTNVSSSTCTLPSPPAVSIVAKGRLLPVRHLVFESGASLGFPRWPRLAMLEAGRTAGVFLQWSNWCGSHRSSLGATIELTFLGHPEAVVARTRLLEPAPRCDSSSSPSTLRVSPFLRYP